MARVKDFGTTYRDVRTREVGINEVKNKNRPDQVEFVRRDYVANGGWETFLAYEDPKQDILTGLLRLRNVCTVPTWAHEAFIYDNSLTPVRHHQHIGRSKRKMRKLYPSSFLLRIIFLNVLGRVTKFPEVRLRTAGRRGNLRRI